MTDVNASAPPFPADLSHPHFCVRSVRLSVLSHRSSSPSLLQETPQWPDHYSCVISLGIWQGKCPTFFSCESVATILSALPFLTAFRISLTSSTESLWGFDQG